MRPSDCVFDRDFPAPASEGAPPRHALLHSLGAMNESTVLYLLVFFLYLSSDQGLLRRYGAC